LNSLISIKPFELLLKLNILLLSNVFRCDLGGEYTSNKFYKLLALDGTIHQISCTDTPTQNRVAERKHRHNVETAHSLLLSASVPSEFWEKDILITVSLINTIISSHISSFLFLKSCIGMLRLFLF